jgi:hypothetical protein
MGDPTVFGPDMDDSTARRPAIPTPPAPLRGNDARLDRTEMQDSAHAQLHRREPVDDTPVVDPEEGVREIVDRETRAWDFTACA